MLTVKDIMTEELFSLQETDSLQTARQAMTQRRIRHIPIVDGADQFVGLVTQRDVLASTVSALAEVGPLEREALEASIPLKEIMITDVMVAEEDTPLRDAAGYLVDHKVGCLPVVSPQGVVTGIVTESDFVHLVIGLLDKLEHHDIVL